MPVLSFGRLWSRPGHSSGRTPTTTFTPPVVDRDSVWPTTAATSPAGSASGAIRSPGSSAPRCLTRRFPVELSWPKPPEPLVRHRAGGSATVEEPAEQPGQPRHDDPGHQRGQGARRRPASARPAASPTSSGSTDRFISSTSGTIAQQRDQEHLPLRRRGRGAAGQREPGLQAGHPGDAGLLDQVVGPAQPLGPLGRGLPAGPATRGRRTGRRRASPGRSRAAAGRPEPRNPGSGWRPR